MNTSKCTGCRNWSHIEDKAPYLTKEDISCAYRQTGGSIWVAIDEAKPGEISRRNECWKTIWIPNQLRVVVLNYGRREQVCAWWDIRSRSVIVPLLAMLQHTRREVDNGRIVGVSLASRHRRTVSISNSSLNSRTVIGNSITNSTVILDVPIHSIG